MAFSRDEFNSLLGRIETYLGYLRGNENAWQYLEAARTEINSTYNEGILDVLILEEGYHFPCPDGAFEVRPSIWRADMYMPPGATYDKYEFIRSIQKSADDAYADGVAWAAGIADYARSICAQFTEPDVTTMTQAILAIQTEVADKLTLDIGDDFAGLGTIPNFWQSDAAIEFGSFYLNYNEGLVRCGEIAGRLTRCTAATAQVIGSTQVGALAFAASMEKGVKAQLKQWAAFGRKPEDPADPPPAWIADVQAIGQAALTVLSDFVTPVKTIVNDVNDVQSKGGHLVELAQAIEDATGFTLLPHFTKRIPVESAEELYTMLATTLKDSYLQKYQDALDSLNAGDTTTEVEPGDVGVRAASGSAVLAAADLTTLLGLLRFEGGTGPLNEGRPGSGRVPY